MLDCDGNRCGHAGGVRECAVWLYEGDYQSHQATAAVWNEQKRAANLVSSLQPVARG